MSTFTWSPQQETVFDAVLSSDERFHNIMIRAYAGCAKSTTELECIQRVRKAHSRAAMVYLAFNKVIVEEFTPRVGSAADVMTTHSYGLKIVTSAMGRVQIDARASWGIMGELVGRWDRDQKRWVAGSTPKAHLANVGTAKALGQLLSAAKNALVRDEKSIEALIARFGIVETAPWTPAEAAQIVCSMLKIQADASRRVIDFDDMLWLPAILNLTPPFQYDYVFGDEVQDWNPAQLDLVQRACKKRGRIILCGDVHQAIYGWRGADPEAIPRMEKALDAATLKLSTTFRCPKAVVRECNRIVPDFAAAPSAPNGSVKTLRKADMLNAARIGDVILSRLNAPLVACTLALLRQGTPAIMRGRDVAGDLVAFMETAQKRHCYTTADLAAYVLKWGMTETARLEAAHASNRTLEAISDKAATIDALAEGLGTIAEVIERTKQLFSDNDVKSKVLLSSVHRAKGLEWQRVWVLRDTFYLLKGDPIEEKNLDYVACSRSKDELIYVNWRNVEDEED